MWHSNWGTVKAPNAKACALYHEIANVGKTIESSKKRVIWRLKVEEGREFEISLTHSLASGKKVLRVDGIVKYTAQALSFGDWDYVFNLPGGHVVHIIIKPSMELNDMYDLIVDGVSFRRLPDRLDGGGGRAKSQSAPPPRAKPTYHYSNGGRGEDEYEDEPNPYERPSYNERDASFSPWECPVCTLVNDKPLAPVCEACGNSKPMNPKLVSRQPRAHSTIEDRRSYHDHHESTPAPPRRQEPPVSDLLGTSEPTPAPMELDTAFNPFETNGFGAAPPVASFANFDSSPAKAAQRAAQPEDFTTMLSGLDFTTQPMQQDPAPVPAPVAVSEPIAEPMEHEKRTDSGSLWSDSKLVDLNLKGQVERKPSFKPTKHGQTLEQARMKESQKEKVPVLPVAPPMATNTSGFAAQLNTAFGAPNFAAPNAFGQQHITVQNTSAYGGFGGGGAFNTYNPQAQSQPQQPYMMGMPPQQFMTNMTTMQPEMHLQKRNVYASDPFATLS